MDIEIIPCTVEQLETLIEGADAFLEVYELRAIDGYMPFAGALQYILNQMMDAQIWHPWLPYLFVFRPDQALVGLGGFKSVPDSSRAVEIGYSVAPAYQGRGFATSAVRQLIKIAFESTLVDSVCAHTLAERNASMRVLEKCGMTKVSEAVDPDVGKVWKWEISAG
ncbi:MAG: GNAT family N-acetyltransferase [Leptolyngbyaceae cyanobacterium SL_7_1]|nr:GNAT family N-acetyltransferase [Leptolyngbyaceae cyanobacterium SL_7_1]